MRCVRRSYDGLKLTSKYIIDDCRVFIPVSKGTKLFLKLTKNTRDTVHPSTQSRGHPHIASCRQSCRTRVLDLDSSRTRVRFLADLDLDLDSVVKDSDLDLDIRCLQTTAVHLEMSYLNLCAQQQTPDSCLTFWSQHERDLNKLHQLAMSVLSVPATSAAVERVFSRNYVHHWFNLS